MTAGDEDPAAVVDLYHAPDIRWVSDGTALDRDRLVAHMDAHLFGTLAADGRLRRVDRITRTLPG